MTFGPVRTTDYRQPTESDAYDPTVQIAQMGSKKQTPWYILVDYFTTRTEFEVCMLRSQVHLHIGFEVLPL